MAARHPTSMSSTTRQSRTRSPPGASRSAARPRFLRSAADDLAKLFTPTLVDGSVDTNYPLVNLCNDNPALPAKFTTTHLRLVWDFATAMLVQVPVLLHTNLDTGATATWETNSANSWP